MTKTMTREEISSALPPKFRGRVSTKLVNEINNIINTTELTDCYKEQFIWYGNILSDTRFSLDNYVKAVKFVSLKSIGHSNISAWAGTYPDRFARLKTAGKSNTEIHNHVGGYSKSALVTKLMAQTMVPAWLVNQSNFQRAINRQVWLMDNAKSETVQTNAANSIITNLKRPDIVELEVNHNIQDSTEMSAIEIYKQAASDLAKLQLEALSKGVTLEAIAESKLEESKEEEKDV